MLGRLKNELYPCLLWLAFSYELLQKILRDLDRDRDRDRGRDRDHDRDRDSEPMTHDPLRGSVLLPFSEGPRLRKINPPRIEHIE